MLITIDLFHCFIYLQLTIMDSVHSNVRGQSLSAHFYRRIQAVILVCSLDNEQSLHRLTHWINEAEVYIKVCGMSPSFHSIRFL